MEAPGGQDRVERVLEELLEYVQSHFADEEKAMAQAGYPSLALHQQKHRAMKVEVERLLRLEREGGVVPNRLMIFLKDWLAKHIGRTDRQYAEALKAAHIV
jgi:hemerythrin